MIRTELFPGFQTIQGSYGSLPEMRFVCVRKSFIDGTSSLRWISGGLGSIGVLLALIHIGQPLVSIGRRIVFYRRVVC